MVEVWSILRHHVQRADIDKREVALYAAVMFVVYPIEKIGLPLIVSGGLVMACIAGNLGDANGRTAVWWGIALLIAIVAVRLGTIALYWLSLRLQQKLSVAVRENVTRDVFAVCDATGDTPREGEWLTHIDNMPCVLEEIFSRLLNNVLPAATAMLCAVAFFFYVDWRLGLACTLLLLGAAVHFHASVGRPQRAARAEYVRQTWMNEAAQDTVRNVAYIRASGAQAFERKRLHGMAQVFAREKRSFCVANTRFLATMDVYVVLLAGCVVWCLLHRAPSMSATVIGGGFFVLLILLKDYDDIKKMMTQVYNYGYKTDVFREAIMRQSASSPPSSTPPPPPTASRAPTAGRASKALPPAVLSCTGVQVALAGANVGQQQHIGPFDLRVRAGTMHAVTGRPGTGKSIVSQAIAGVRPVAAGSVRLHGADATRLPDVRRRHVVYMPQQAHLFEASIHDNIVYNTDGVSHADVMRTLRDLGLERAFCAPRASTAQRHGQGQGLGCSTRRSVGVRGSQLSGGQQQLLLVVRAYVRATREQARPSVLIFDEPTASLDSGAKRLVLAALRRLARKGHAVVMITHDTECVRACDDHTTFRRPQP